MKPVRSIAALGLAGALYAPLPAAAAPAPCERAENYAAQSGAEVLHLIKLTTTSGHEPGGKHGRDQGGSDHDEAGAGGHDARPGPASGAATDSGSAAGGAAAGTSTGGGATDGGGSSTGSGTRKGGGATEQQGGAAGQQGRGLESVLGRLLPSRYAPAAGAGRAGPPVQTPAGPAEAGATDDESRTAEVDLSDAGLGDARSAMIAQATVNSAAIGSAVDGVPADRSLAHTAQQQAPPTNENPVTVTTNAGKAGPFTFGAGTLSAHAQWDPGMACTAVTGETTRARAGLARAGLGDGLVAMPRPVEGVSTTRVERGASVATATVSAGKVTLLDGAVTVKVLRAPALTARMSATGGTVTYTPARVEVSGGGIASRRLDVAGDRVDLDLSHGRRNESTVLDPLLSSLAKGPKVSLPVVPTLPQPPGEPESGVVAGAGTKVRVALGEVRTAKDPGAIAARATAVRIVVTQGSTDDGYGASHATVLDLGIGSLEAAAVAPAGGVRDASAGTGGGLPITGSNSALVAAIGAALILAGGAVIAFTRRGRRSGS